jgi:hypothetical protein
LFRLGNIGITICRWGGGLKRFHDSKSIRQRSIQTSHSRVKNHSSSTSNGPTLSDNMATNRQSLARINQTRQKCVFETSAGTFSIFFVRKRKTKRTHCHLSTWKGNP